MSPSQASETCASASSATSAKCRGGHYANASGGCQECLPPSGVLFSLRISAFLCASAVKCAETSLPQKRRGTQRLAEKRFQNKTQPTAGDARIDLDRNHDRG